MNKPFTCPILDLSRKFRKKCLANNVILLIQGFIYLTTVICTMLFIVSMMSVGHKRESQRQAVDINNTQKPVYCI